jgi:hypothetical protein
MNRTRWILAVLLLGLAGLVLFQHQQLLGLRSENEGLRLRLIQGQEQTVPPPKTAEVTAEELERLRSAEHEVLRLRGEISRLRTELQAALRSADQGRQGKPATNQWITGFQPLQATVQAEVPNGQMLAVGGWPGHEGNRLLLLASPRLAAEGSDQVAIEIRAIEGTDAFLAKFGLEGMNGAGDAGRFQQVLSAPQTEAIMKALAEAPGKAAESDPDTFTRSLYIGSVTAANGQVASLLKPVAILDESWSMGGSQQPQPGENLRMMGLDLGPYAGPQFVALPVMSGDNTTVSLRFQGTLFKRTPQTP